LVAVVAVVADLRSPRCAAGGALVGSAACCCLWGAPSGTASVEAGFGTRRRRRAGVQLKSRPSLRAARLASHPATAARASVPPRSTASAMVVGAGVVGMSTTPLTSSTGAASSRWWRVPSRDDFFAVDDVADGEDDVEEDELCKLLCMVSAASCWSVFGWPHVRGSRGRRQRRGR
jgi:hypothetical protein